MFGVADRHSSAVMHRAGVKVLALYSLLCNPWDDAIKDVNERKVIEGVESLSRVSHFQRFSQPENHATNNTLLVLRYFYQSSPFKIQRVSNLLA